MTSAKAANAISGQEEPSIGIETARRVIRLEISGLDALYSGLDEKFNDALCLLCEMSGHAVVVGMGKSGHVSRKIAATLASTGTPALFVHPGEASHGDLGMITGNDVVLALSSSGETAELADLLAYAKYSGIPLIAITGAAGSTLAVAADVALILPDCAEACPMGLAPTTSTTMMMALGDAIAVALLERKGFSRDDFHILHPGGRLGLRLLKVSDIMHSGDEMPLVDGALCMADTLLMMTAKSFGVVGIIDSRGRLEGVITDGDLRRHMNPSLLGDTAAEVMTSGVKSIHPETLVGEAVQIMNSHSITNIFVVECDRPVGILHIHDCLRIGLA